MKDKILVCKDFSNEIRWRPGERLHHLFEYRCDQLSEACDTQHLAVDSTEGAWTYKELDERANQLARYLKDQGFGAGDVIGLLFDKSVHSYVSMLAVLKIHAAYVPLDPAFPEDRITFIASDAGLNSILTMSQYLPLSENSGLPVVCVDTDSPRIDAQDNTRLDERITGQPVSELCYIIYTSGSTGRPKGVPIEHASICNFIRVAAEVYDYRSRDRVYQGLTIAFDFSVEEIWVPFFVGATLLPNETGSSLLGADLSEFLRTRKATAMCCVPTLLATIDEELPDIRFLIVSGEACPDDLITRWHSPHRTILNAYGPTEATVTATLSWPKPNEPVTIGKPLPTYTIVILEPGTQRVMPFGEEGEIAIAGVGVAQGYLNREDQTRKAFIKDFLNIPNNTSGLIYRTGDLGLINENNDIEYRGRIDTQVKIRGYRIELTEIESVILQIPQIGQAVVDTFEPVPGVTELVAYYTLKAEAPPFSQGELVDVLRSLLPNYMIPAFYEHMQAMPMMASDKINRKALPDPSSVRMNVDENRMFVEPQGHLEKDIARVLASILKLDAVSVEDNFFDDLGANSLLMAHFSTKLREIGGITNVSMRDIYMHPTVQQLSGHIDSMPKTNLFRIAEQSYRIPKVREYITCGVLQFLFYISALSFGLWVLLISLSWITNASSVVDVYIRVVGLGVFLFCASTAVPIALKWILIGKWKATKFPIWSLKYFRFWVLKQLFLVSPMALFKGTEFFSIYLRLMGAKIGRNVVIYSKFVPVCTDLLTIGDDSILRKDSIFLGYKAQSGYIHTGPTTIGSGAFVGEAAVLDINTTMEDRTQLGHSSSLQENQVIPAGKRYHGSPAQETHTDYCTIEPKRCSSLRRFAYPATQLWSGLFVFLPIPFIVAHSFFPGIFDPSKRIFMGTETIYMQIFPGLSLIPYLMLFTLAFFFGALLLGLLTVVTVPRLLHMLLKEEKPYVLYGVHYYIFGLISGISNSRTLNLIFGDSSFIVYYLKAIGYNLGKVKQTGSNFGVAQKHDNPLLCNIGRGTMVSDGLSMINADFSNSSFRLSRTKIGEDNFLGNNINYPTNGKTGKNCLLATKVMIPVDGEVRENVGLLGAPCFEIPRSVRRDKFVKQYEEGSIFRDRLHQKDVSNLVTMGMYLFSQWLYGYVALLFGLFVLDFFQFNLIFRTAAIVIFMFFFTLGYFVFVERLSLGFKRLKPLSCSIYDPYYWKHERHWKFNESPLIFLFKGTPFKNLISRLLGIKMGRMVFDDGMFASEKTLTEVGDYSTLNESSLLQGHSLEEGVFKSDHIKIGEGCTIGVNTLVHYGVKMSENVILDPDAFLMKGETPEANSKWQGNPAKALLVEKTMLDSDNELTDLRITPPIKQITPIVPPTK